MRAARLVVAAVAAAALLPGVLAAQIVSYEGAALETSWYAPELDYYQTSDVFAVAFTGSVLTQVHVDFELFRRAVPFSIRIRTSAGYWDARGSNAPGSDDPGLATPRTSTLRIVPLTAAVLLAPPRLPRPVLGLGISRNLIQRSFERTRADRLESVHGNGRDLTYHLLLGVEVPLFGAVAAGVESRYVWGHFVDDGLDRTAPPGSGELVSLAGPQLGISIQYRIR